MIIMTTKLEYSDENQPDDIGAMIGVGMNVYGNRMKGPVDREGLLLYIPIYEPV